MAVVLDAVSSGDNGAGTPLSWSHSGGSAPSIAIVGVCHQAATAGVPTYGGVAMTEILTESQWVGIVTLHYIISPAGGSQTVSVSKNSGGRASGFCMTLEGSHLTDPIRDSDEVFVGSAGTAPTLTLDSEDGDFAFDVLLQYDRYPNADASQTEIATYDWGAGLTRGAGASYEQATGSSITMSWMDAVQHIFMACTIQPAPTGRNRLVKYFTNTYDPRSRIVDNQGRNIPKSQVQIDEFFRSEGPYFPTPYKPATLLKERGVGYIESDRYNDGRESVAIDVVTESRLEVLFRRMSGGAV